MKRVREREGVWDEISFFVNNCTAVPYITCCVEIWGNNYKSSFCSTEQSHKNWKQPMTMNQPTDYLLNSQALKSLSI